MTSALRRLASFHMRHAVPCRACRVVMFGPMTLSSFRPCAACVASLCKHKCMRYNPYTLQHRHLREVSEDHPPMNLSSQRLMSYASGGRTLRTGASAEYACTDSAAVLNSSATVSAVPDTFWKGHQAKTTSVQHQHSLFCCFRMCLWDVQLSSGQSRDHRARH
jgi:hypothetical protein